jgi:hypothetical protein
VREYWPTAALTATVVLGISAAASLLLVIGTKFGVSYTPPTVLRIRDVYPEPTATAAKGEGGTNFLSCFFLYKIKIILVLNSTEKKIRAF